MPINLSKESLRLLLIECRDFLLLEIVSLGISSLSMIQLQRLRFGVRHVDNLVLLSGGVRGVRGEQVEQFSI